MRGVILTVSIKYLDLGYSPASSVIETLTSLEMTVTSIMIKVASFMITVTSLLINVTSLMTVFNLA